MGAASSAASAVTRRVGARCLFGEMPDTGAAPPAAGGEGIDVLPDGVLAHILGILPAEEAVRTSVLAQRWRHLWKSATSLHVVAADGHFLGSVEKLVEFMDRLLPLREGASLDTCNLDLGDFRSRWHDFQVSDAEDVLCRIDAWFRHVAACRVRFLRLVVCCEEEGSGCPDHALFDLPLVSRHLKRLELQGVKLGSSLLDFSSCPALEHLVFDWCDLSEAASTISFQSLKHLNMTSCMLKWHSRIHIDAPNLVSLCLDNFGQRTPMLESMPLLVNAFVIITQFCEDQCYLWRAHFKWGCYCQFCETCESIGGADNSSVLLKGLSEAENLTLISEPIMFIFRMDLRRCPTFSKLKTLLLNDYWCIPDEFSALACILEHLPLLEKLTLQLFSKGPAHKVQLKGSINPRLRCASISEHLKTVEVKCEVIDKRILKVLKFLHFKHQ